MINLDQYVVAFVKENLITLSLMLGTLKIVATMTKNTLDNKISTLLSNTFAMIRGKSPQGAVEMPRYKDRGEEFKG